MASQEALAELNRLCATNGGILLPEKVVEAAESPSSPLHQYFDWDDSVAAHRHRISQAEALIRTYRITYSDRGSETIKFQTRPLTPATVPHFTPNPVRGYSPTVEVLQTQPRAVLMQELERLRGHVGRFCGYLAAAGLVEVAQQIQRVFDLVESAIASVGRAEVG